MRFLYSPARTKLEKEVFVANLIILLFIFRGAIPFFKYPFIFIYTGFIIYLLIFFRKIVLVELKQFIKAFILPLFVFLLLFIQFISSDKVYLQVFKEVVNAIFLFSFFFMLKIIINSRDEFKLFSKNFLRITIYFALIISIFEFISIFEISSYYGYNLTETKSEIYPTNQASIDYNFASLPAFFGIIAALFFLGDSQLTNLTKTKYILFITFFSTYIFISGSRRGIIMLFLIYSILILLIIISILMSKRFLVLKKISLKRNRLFSLLLFQLVFFFFFIFLTPFNIKNTLLDLLGSKNILKAKSNIVSNIVRSTSVFNKNITYAKLYDLLWSSSFNPKDPDSSWGTRIHRTVFPLIGNNVEIVPPEAKGYLMDSTCNADTWSGDAFSYTQIWNTKLRETDKAKAYVYCFVSEDFNGDWVKLISDRATYDISNEYDLLRKGIWQKLSLKQLEKGNSTVYFYFCKTDVVDFSSMKGYVIFANPVVEFFNQQNSPSSRNNYLMKSNSKKSFCISSIESDRYLFSSIAPSLNIEEVRIYFNSIMVLQDKDRSLEDKDPIRNWFLKLIPEDTTYTEYIANLDVKSASDSFTSLRIIRWEFALQIFMKEFSWKEKIFGGGFNFLNWYGYYFLQDKKQTDYPHNPFLHVLLYSGLFGLILYLIFIYKVFRFYFKYILDYKIFAMFFLITLFFSFFSAGNPFDPPIMGFFSILPFFIHSIHNKSEKEQKHTSSVIDESD